MPTDTHKPDTAPQPEGAETPHRDWLGAGNGRDGENCDPLPGPLSGLEDQLGIAQAGIKTLWVLWNDHCGGEDDLNTALYFCITGIDDALDRMDALIEAAYAERKQLRQGHRDSGPTPQA
jgi:hypothetical protein